MLNNLDKFFQAHCCNLSKKNDTNYLFNLPYIIFNCLNIDIFSIM